MTKRRNLAIIIALAMSVLLSACDGTTNSNSDQETKAEIEFEPFVMLDGEYNIEKNGFDKGYYQYILYDPETKVMYTLIWCHARGETGITVIYNADGTPKLYDPEEEKTE